MLELMGEMRRPPHGLPPNEHTANALLRAYATAAKWDDVTRLLANMAEELGVAPSLVRSRSRRHLVGTPTGSAVRRACVRVG